MPIRTLLLLAILASTPAPAQTRHGGISGLVTDTARRPLADADVFILGGGRRARTDSAGRFRFADLKPGAYALIARKVGYRHAEAEVSVHDDVVRQDFALARRVILGTVEVRERAECPLRTIDGFFCRQQRRSGTFLDYPDIDFYAHTYTGDLFRHLPGWRVRMRRAPDGGLVPVPARSGPCALFLVDGRVVPWERVPLYTADLTGMEVYVRPDTVPPEVQREMNFHSSPARGINSRSCDAVVFWTRRAGT